MVVEDNCGCSYEDIFWKKCNNLFGEKQQFSKCQEAWIHLKKRSGDNIVKVKQTEEPFSLHVRHSANQKYTDVWKYFERCSQASF